MPSPFYVEPAGTNLGPNLAGLGNIIAVGREKKKQEEEQARKDQEMKDAQADILAAFQSGDPMAIAEASIKHPAFREHIGTAFGIRKDIQEEQEREEKAFYQSVLADPANIERYLAERIDRVTARGGDPAQTLELMQEIEAGDVDQALESVQSFYAMRHPEDFKKWKDATAPAEMEETFEELFDEQGNVIAQRNMKTQQVVSDPRANASREDDTYETMYDADGNVVAQRNTRTNQVVTDPRAFKESAKKDITPAQRLAAGFAKRTTDSGSVISELGDKFTGLMSRGVGVMPQGFRTEDRQKFDQATRDFINATLRRESGASIQATEFESANLQYIPQPGDSETLLDQKKRNRETISKALQLEAGEAFTELSDALGTASTFEPVAAGPEDTEGDEAVNSDGVVIVVKNGQWVKK